MSKVMETVKYEDIASANFLQNQTMSCPEPTEDFLPCCRQAGEMQKKRCDGLTTQGVMQGLNLQNNTL